MRWENLCKGNKRIRKKFLWFPKGIGEITRWWEYAEWEEVVVFKYVFSEQDPYWKPTRWTDLDKKEKPVSKETKESNVADKLIKKYRGKDNG